MACGVTFSCGSGALRTSSCCATCVNSQHTGSMVLAGCSRSIAAGQQLGVLITLTITFPLERQMALFTEMPTVATNTTSANRKAVLFRRIFFTFNINATPKILNEITQKKL